MKTINKPGNNLGGLTKIWAVPYSVYSVSGKNVSFSDTSNIYEIYCSPDSMDFDEPKTLTNAGIHYNTAINGFIPGDSEETQEAITYLEPRKWVLIFKDGNGKFKAAGTQFTPLRMTPNLNTGKDTIGRAGYSFKFYGPTVARAIFINNPF